MMKRFGREYRRCLDGQWPSGCKERVVFIFGNGRQTSSTTLAFENSGQGLRHGEHGQFDQSWGRIRRLGSIRKGKLQFANSLEWRPMYLQTLTFKSMTQLSHKSNLSTVRELLTFRSGRHPDDTRAQSRLVIYGMTDLRDFHGRPSPGFLPIAKLQASKTFVHQLLTTPSIKIQFIKT